MRAGDVLLLRVGEAATEIELTGEGQLSSTRLVVGDEDAPLHVEKTWTYRELEFPEEPFPAAIFADQPELRPLPRPDGPRERE